MGLWTIQPLVYPYFVNQFIHAKHNPAAHPLLLFFPCITTCHFHEEPLFTLHIKHWSKFAPRPAHLTGTHIFCTCADTLLARPYAPWAGSCFSLMSYWPVGSQRFGGKGKQQKNINIVLSHFTYPSQHNHDKTSCVPSVLSAKSFICTSLNSAGMNCTRKGEPEQQLGHNSLPIFTHTDDLLCYPAEHWTINLSSFPRTICPWVTLNNFLVPPLIVLLLKAFCHLCHCLILFPYCRSCLF